MDFGAFVNFFGAKDGLVHISQLAPHRVNKVTDVVKEGDKVKVKLLGMDERGKVRLSMKVVDQATGEDLEAKQKAEGAPQQAAGGARSSRPGAARGTLRPGTQLDSIGHRTLPSRASGQKKGRPSRPPFLFGGAFDAATPSACVTISPSASKSFRRGEVRRQAKPDGARRLRLR